MIFVIAFGISIVAYGIYLFAVGEKHRSEEHLLATRPFVCADARFECRYATKAGLAVIGFGVVAAGFLLSIRG